LSYGYNEDGLVSDVVEGDGSVVTYNYDPLFRLISEQRVGSYAYTVSYEYDAAGNRLAKVWDGQRTDYVYDKADRLQFYVKPDGSVVAYDWDANGNMIARTEGNQTTEFEYDYDNRLVRIVYPNGSEVRFGYDGLGRRVFRQEGANVRYFYYDGDKIIAEREGSSWVVRYLLGLKPCGHVVSGQVRVYHADRLGSVRWVTDGSGNLVASYVYEGFGKIVGQEGSEVVPYRFCGLWGYRNDGDAGLLHVGARYYEVETGRWVQKDKMLGYTLSPITLNYYVYCNSDPINHIDPLGYTAWWPVVLVIGLVIGVAIVVAVYVYYRTRDKGTAVEAGATVPGYAVPGSELTGPVQAAPDIARIKHIDNAGTTNQLSSPNVEYTHEFDRILEQRDRRATIHYKAIHQMSQR
jgi:RHS repeat-associated protein